MPVTNVERVTGDILISQKGGFNIQYVACDELSTFRYGCKGSIYFDTP